MDVLLGLGANVGDALETLAAAVYALDDIDGLRVTDVSGVYRTAPWPPAGDPRAVTQEDFFNAVVRAECTLDPAALLAECQLVEAAFGRDRTHEVRWGPRPLDVDVLMYGDEELDVVTDVGPLVVPHPQLAHRAFVLVPLMEVLPGGRLPDGRKLTQLLMELGPLDGIEFEVRFDDVPGFRIARPSGPVGGAAQVRRPSSDATAEEHGA